jgi:hypothetical protein
MLTKRDAGYVSTKSPRYYDETEPKEFTLLSTSVGETIPVVSCGNAMGTAVLTSYFILCFYF